MDNPAEAVSIEGRDSPPKSRFGFAIRAGLGLALVVTLLWLCGADRVAQVLSRERPGFFVAAIALYFAGQMMSSYRWQLLARLNGFGGLWREYLAYYFVGVFTNLFVPGLVGGDAARARYLGLRHRRVGAAVASVVADRGVGLVALFWFAAIAALTATSVRIPAALIHLTVALGLTALLGYLAGPLLATVASRFSGRVRAIAEPLTPYLRNQRGMIVPLALSMVLQASLALCQYLLAVGMGIAIPFSAVLLIVPMANVVASIPLTINGLGVRESAYLLLFGLAGVARQDAIALGLVWFASTLVAGLSGLWPFVVTPAPKPEIIREPLVQSTSA
ncbi:MAG TPA: lysylphosphatidylglycerol synthase transmembrane domain-containing protein [Candidatus Binataceae bacterium]|nr:lysylphosphatidylglycerol synthase transmembrane domain-containing protein [Candidatus Binataceae bacterium]